MMRLLMHRKVREKENLYPEKKKKGYMKKERKKLYRERKEERMWKEERKI